MIEIRRTGQNKYLLKDPDGVIAEYEQTAMKHPHDWIDDAEDAGISLNNPTNWEYIDARNLE